jgi:predicted TIM-barrel fold metal-dependent hydrolase
VGFTHYDENNEQLLRICAEYPGRFEAWPTMDPRDPQKLDKFAALAARGAKGLKLYLGHGYIIKKTNQYLFHTAALDDPGMLSVYRYCEENFIPVCVHVNLNPDAAPGFAEEFVSMLTQFPDMKVVCPHCMLSSKWPSRIKEFLETFPNLYTDVSFGQDDFLVQALRRFSKNPARYRGLIQQYPNRFMFSTDLVVTEEPIKDQKWITDRFNTYLDMLTKKTFTTPVAPNEVFHGLELPPALLDRVLYKNFQEFAAFRPAHTQIRRSINWSKTGIAPDTNRRPGQSLPPPIK